MKRQFSRPQKGIALVLVLAFLVIITILVLGFFSAVTSQVTVSDSQAKASTTQQLSDSAINLVMGQLVDGTKGVDTTTGTSANLAWASQPGMIRTWDASGNGKQCFKLYSSDKLTIAASELMTGLDYPPADWNSVSNSNLYTDINAPGIDSKNGLVYPIADPQADGRASTSKISSKSPDNHATDQMGAVLGFSLTDSPGYSASRDESPTNNRAAMPVRWIYVLQDGTMVTPTTGGASGSSQGTVTVTGATKANPIVGRIAFWTDDESSKVNINTASEGTYWDMPRIWSYEDYGQLSGPNSVTTPGLAVCQPNQHEFQRYPGHPATTCLSPIFGSIAGFNPNYGYTKPSPARPTATDGSSLDVYYNMAPKIGLAFSSGGGGGGSKAGSTLNPSAVITADTDRLYASVEELMFTPRTTGSAPPSRVPITAAASAIAPNKLLKSHLEKAQFFLTAHSNAPEVTLFNTPRISMWPVNVTTSLRTPFDSLSAFCSTTGVPTSGGQKPYYFTRSNPRSSTADYTTRNAQLYSYLQKLTSANVPGFGGNFFAKFGTGPTAPSAVGTNDRDQVLTEIYDYIRCTNLQDFSAKNLGIPSYTPLFDNNLRLAGNTSVVGAGEVLPIKIGNTQGFGRFNTVSAAYLHFYSTSFNQQTQRATNMRCIFYVQPSSVCQGFGLIKPKLKFTVTGLDKFKVQFEGAPNSIPLGLPAGGTDFTDGADIQTIHGRSLGGTECPNQYLYSTFSGPTSKAFKQSSVGASSHTDYPFFSANDIPVPATLVATGGKTFFSFTGNSDSPDDNVVIKLYSDDSSSTLLQTINLKFPSSKFVVPLGNAVPTPFGPRDISAGVNLIVGTDTVYGVQVAGKTSVAASSDNPNGTDATVGDIRMVAGLSEVPATRFRPHQNYLLGLTGQAPQFAHGMLTSVGELMGGGLYGALVDGSTNYYYQSAVGSVHRQPDVPSRVPSNKGVQRVDGGRGDWDTGWGDQKDGSYINRPDEGDTAFSDNEGAGYRSPYSTGYYFGTLAASNSFFSPMRQVPSAMMLGSLPTGVQRMQPWQTLSFAPRPDDVNHPGNKGPKDHLLADLFWMPAVEPWAISTPFATAGKINMNYQIMPFTYIKRQTGMYAVMRATKFLGIPFSDITNYKPLDPATNATAMRTRVPDARYGIDIARTLQAFETKFTGNTLFKSATEICEMDLYPVGYTGSMASFWANNTLTGDNLREKPYADLYPRLTTKSNTYNVHVRVQTIKKVPASSPDQFDSTRDKIVGEYRGSSILERYIDVNDPNIPDFALKFTGSATDSPNIDHYYKIRVVSTKRFAP